MLNLVKEKGKNILYSFEGPYTMFAVIFRFADVGVVGKTNLVSRG